MGYERSLINADDELVIFQWILFGLIILLIALGIIFITYYFIMKKQKEYFQKIIDSSTNIVIINNGVELLDVNKTFFHYFSHEKSLEEFKEKYKCICDLFMKGDGYLQSEMDGGILWLKYLMKYPSVTPVAKINYNENIYYFKLSSTLISKEEGHYSVVMSDITKEEEYKLSLKKLSITDPLIGIYNRRYFDTKLAENIVSADRYDTKFSLIMTDIDYFKKVNDEHGHDVGDKVLIEYTKLISEIIREGDLFFRVGGEEFMIIVPYSSREQAQEIAQKLRAEVENHKKILPITMSFGVTEYVKGETSDHIYKRVDDALYEAKENGRNRVVIK